ncbi:MAG: hypothetical protein ACRCVJ_01820 [Clostridium sp.]
MVLKFSNNLSKELIRPSFFYNIIDIHGDTLKVKMIMVTDTVNFK